MPSNLRVVGFRGRVIPLMERSQSVGGSGVFWSLIFWISKIKGLQ